MKSSQPEQWLVDTDENALRPGGAGSQ